MPNTSVIIKLEDVSIQNHSKIVKLIGNVNATNIAKLIDVVGLEANPRRSKKGKVTDAIEHTLETSPELMRFKSKGLLISTTECDTLERNRFRLSFTDTRYEGVLDGGHNVLAIALFILSRIEMEKPIRIRRWDELKPIWQENRDRIESTLKVLEVTNNFQVPIEILFPSSEYDTQDFIQNVLEISDGRNNNAELTAETKAHHSGLYDELKNHLDPLVREKVEWTTNEIGKSVRSADIAALALIPMYVLQNHQLLPDIIPQINLVNIYSSKAKCVQILNEIMKTVNNDDGEIMKNANGNNIDGDSLQMSVTSALKIMKDIPRLYDLIFELFPDAYKHYSQRFGGISSVKIYEEGKKGESYLKRPPQTKFYGKDVKYQYPDGFILPIVCSLTELLEVDSQGVLHWKHDPFVFIEKSLDESIELFVHMIKSNEYNPQTVGKNAGAYIAMAMSFKQEIAKQKTSE